MSNQPPLPDMPPMKPMAAASSEQPTIPQQQAKPVHTGGNKRMRQIVGYVAGGGFSLVLVICAAQLALRPGIRPTDLMATIEAQTDMGVFNQKMGAAAGEMILTEDQYREKIAEAERSGQAKAELAYQRDLAAVQADKERVVGAYQVLYQRTNIIAQAGVQMEGVAQQFRQRLIEQTNGGRVMVISIYDGLCALGNADACESARQARAGMIAESTTLTEGDLAQKIQKLMEGIPDPASLVAERDMQQNGAPAIQR